LNRLSGLISKRLFITGFTFIWLFLISQLAVFAESTGDSEAGVNSFIPLMFALGIILLASRTGGALARRLGQPRVLGQLIVGVVLGPTLLDMLHWQVLQGVDLQHTIKELAELGVLLLMFNIGLEVHLSELAKVGKVAVFAGVLGVVTPIGMTMIVVMPIGGVAWQPALFAGVTLAATSVSISAQVLLELGYLRTKEGNALLATALIDDVLAILAVSLTLVIAAPASSGEGDFSTLVIIVAQMAGYIIIAFLIAWYILPRVIEWIKTRPELEQSYGIPVFALAVALLFGWSAEYLGGVAAITGAFIAGVGLSKLSNRNIKHEIEQTMSHLAYVFLVPIFFVDVGLETDLSSFPPDAILLTVALLIVAIISKVVGSWLGARMGGFDNWESLRVGVCMISRGEVGLIIISIGLSNNMLESSSPLYASLFMVILLTTVLTPPMVRWVFQQNRTDESSTNNPTLATATSGD
jgi:Kef-type K+ transport system membrane component KefB